MLLLGLFAIATLINPIVSSNATLGGDAWLGLMATALVVGAISSVLWERSQHRRRIAAVLLLAVCLIIVGLIGLRAGGPSMLIGTASLLAGIIALIKAAVEGVSDRGRRV